MNRLPVGAVGLAVPEMSVVLGAVGEEVPSLQPADAEINSSATIGLQDLYLIDRKQKSSRLQFA
jgi:hypothetical protein